MDARAIANISLEALSHNLHVIRAKVPEARILSMVKANAYGHGISVCLPALEDSDALGVACLEEAAALKALGWKKPIVVMEGCFTSEAFQWCAENNIYPVVHSLFQIEILKKTVLQIPLLVWLEIDTGMHRLGLLPTEISTAMTALRQCAQVKIECCFSHFSDAAAERNDKVQLQLDRFQECAPGLLVDKSFVNSAGVFYLPEAHHQWIRPGLSLYGISPVSGKIGSELGLKPVMTLRAPLIAKRFVPAMESVGYTSQWRAPEKGSWIGTVGMGYGDGYPWQTTVSTVAEILGKQVPMVGRISMDSLGIDLTGCEEAEIGDWVTLWGPGLPVECIAAQVQQLSYVLLVGLTARVVRQRI